MKLHALRSAAALLSMLLLAAPLAPALAAPPGLKSGTDYVPIDKGEALDPQPGKVEVVEFFNYACPACNSFNPTFQAWKKKLAADVHVVYAPLDFRPDFVQYARAFYAAEQFGLVEKTHDAVYAGVHEKHTLPGEGYKPDEAKIAAFYAGYGANPTEFQAAMDSFTVNAKIAKARQYAQQCRVMSTPSLVINGRYLVKGKDWDEILKNADTLIAYERKR
ncbi:thiol:disulfide interchange protein DsbA/DsbL [Solimonas soli]|uniref:thiol:disulfide interchange protein DsbA/DsbL n=1 Tax=Solimonas soli TaxID=413479 RepID=UPI00047F5608|nr:thiol:disulfide interchange protein DsbA/DsbL [Solimonas soli]